MPSSKMYQFSLILAILILTACGAQAQTQPVSSEVTLQLSWVHQAQFAGFYVADEENLYDEEYLDVEFAPGGPGINVIDKVVAKEATFGVTDPIRLLQARASGQPIVAIAAIFKRDPNVWISLAEKNITTPEDMIGKRVGVKASTEAPYRMLLAVSGIKSADLTEVTLDDPTIRPLVEGEVDVLPGFALNELLAAQGQGHDINVITLSDQGVNLPAQILFTHEELLASDADLVSRFLRASIKGWEDASKNPELGVEATLQVDETLNVDHQRAMMATAVELVNPDAGPVGQMNDQVWQQVMQLALDQGLISKPVELADFYTTRFLP